MEMNNEDLGMRNGKTCVIVPFKALLNQLFQLGTTCPFIPVSSNKELYN